MNSLKDDRESIRKMGTKKRTKSIFWHDVVIVVGFIVLAAMTLQAFLSE